jgi:SAM-dependent methyltransferase
MSAAAVSASHGCGNPTALADLRPGETVLDLGCGGGLDVLLSARRVAPGGKAYGVDMTPDMLALARRNQADAGVTNAEFLAGNIENLPLPNATVDVVISNCVINLTADKSGVLREAFRVLRPSGRLAFCDIVLLRPLPEVARSIPSLWSSCVAGALLPTDYVATLEAAGFADVSVDLTPVRPRRSGCDGDSNAGPGIARRRHGGRGHRRPPGGGRQCLRTGNETPCGGRGAATLETR